MVSEKNDKPDRIIYVISNEYRNRYISKNPGRIIRAGGCEFHLFKYIDEYGGQEVIDLPRFDENPEYTGEGRPFILTLDDQCPFGKKDDPDNPGPSGCNDCVWCRIENPADPIGVCMCDERKQKSKEEQPK